MKLQKVEDIFYLSRGEIISKRNLFDLIQFSKVEDSHYWSGQKSVIGNTPQQGINWVGRPPNVQAVIIKTREGAYKNDGWANSDKSSYHYSFKARKGEISYKEKANSVLIQQPQHQYPIFLFVEQENSWRFEGLFSLSEIKNTFVVLTRLYINSTENLVPQDELTFQEGERKYVTHLMAERNKDVVRLLKETNEWFCDICGEEFHEQYGVKYIEAHHKTPIYTYTSNHTITLSDFALLCPNCHKAVHIYMKKKGLEYMEIKKKLRIRET